MVGNAFYIHGNELADAKAYVVESLPSNVVCKAPPEQTPTGQPTRTPTVEPTATLPPQDEGIYLPLIYNQ